MGWLGLEAGQSFEAAFIIGDLVVVLQDRAKQQPIVWIIFDYRDFLHSSRRLFVSRSLFWARARAKSSSSIRPGRVSLFPSVANCSIWPARFWTTRAPMLPAPDFKGWTAVATPRRLPDCRAARASASLAGA